MTTLKDVLIDMGYDIAKYAQEVTKDPTKSDIDARGLIAIKIEDAVIENLQLIVERYFGYE